MAYKIYLNKKDYSRPMLLNQYNRNIKYTFEVYMEDGKPYVYKDGDVLKLECMVNNEMAFIKSTGFTVEGNKISFLLDREITLNDGIGYLNFIVENIHDDSRNGSFRREIFIEPNSIDEDTSLGGSGNMNKQIVITAKEELDKSINKASQTVKDFTAEAVNDLLAKGELANMTIGDGSITPNKTSFIKATPGKNIFNPNNISKERAIKKEDGTAIYSLSHNSSDYIPIEGNKEYVCSKDLADSACYDKDKKYIEGVNLYNLGGKPFKLPSNAKYIRCSIPIRLDAKNMMIVEGTILPPVVIPYKESLKIDNLSIDNLDTSDIKIQTKNIVGEIDIDKNSFIDRIPTDNIIPEYYEVATGYWQNGTIIPARDVWHKVNLIEIEPSTEYTCWRSIFQDFFDENKKFIGETNAMTFTTPSNAKYIGFNSWGDMSSNPFYGMLVKGKVYPSEFISYYKYQIDKRVIVGGIGKSKIDGLKMCCLGDSITEGVGTTKQYHQFIKEWGNLREVKNFGIGWSTIAVTNNRPDINKNPMCNRYQLMDDDADIITVLAGLNDKYFSVPIGTYDDIQDTTFYGACHKLFGGLKEKYCNNNQDTKIVVFTPFQGDLDGNDYKSTYKKFLPYITAIKEVTATYGIPCYDLFSSALIKPMNHPPITGHKLIAEKMYNFICSLYV